VPAAPAATPSAADPAQATAPTALPGLTSPARASEVPALAGLIGLRVHEIQFRSPSVTDSDRLRALLPLKPGQALDKLKLRRSIQALYATGRFADIQVEAERRPNNDVDLVFIAQENYFVGRLTLFGAPRGGPSDHQLLAATKFQVGELFTQEKLERSLEAMRRVLEDGGYYKGTITPQFLRHPETQQIDITFVVVPGEQAHIGQVTVTGSPGTSPEEVIEIAKFHPGDRASLARVNRALQRLRKKYQKQDRLEAQVTITTRSYNTDTNTVDYVFNIVRGPMVAVRLEGAKLRKGLIKKYVPIYEENAVDNDLLNEGRRNLRDYYQTQGYFNVQIDYLLREQPLQDQVKVVYTLEMNGRHKLVAVAIQGNRYFDTKLLRERMNIQSAGLLLSHGLFSSDMLNRDVQTIIALYQANGFRQVKVREEVEDNFDGIRGHMRVVLYIDEGPQTRVASLTLVGVKSFSESEIRDLLTTLEGQPFSESNIVTDRDSVTNFYFNRGFPNVEFESSFAPASGDATRMNVTYTIQEGERIFVDKVLVTGPHYTRPYIVDREILVHPGGPLSQQEMLETQRRLYDLGLFSQADAAVQNPQGEEPYKNLLVNLYEAQRYTIDYGLGFEVQTGSPVTQTSQGSTGASPRVSFGITRTNFRGRNETIFFKSHVGRLQKRVLLSYVVPRWFNRDLKLTFNTFYDDTRDVTTFTSSRLEGSVQAEQHWSKATTLLYRFSYRLVKVDASTLVIDPNLIPLLSRPERVGMPSFSFIRDTRDDPINSHKGTYFVFDTGLASKVFGSQASFGRFLAQHSTYHAFGAHGKYVLARSTRIGFEPPFGAPGALIPLPERFFAGGGGAGNFLRGFGLNQAGPRDRATGSPLGGESMFVNSMELRLPPLALPYLGRSVSPVLFHDMGNVFAGTGELFPSLFRWTQKDRQQCELLTITATCDLNYLSHAIGGGFRYNTPIGPVRLDFGYNLNPPTFPVRAESRVQTLRRFNFSFSIGQTF
jgi:outer membrane protein assembly complex protein YaeT